MKNLQGLTMISENLIKDGDAISYPHYYRMGDKGLQIILKKLKEYKKKGIILYASAIFDNTDPWLAEAFADGTIAGLYGNVYRKIGARVMRGDFLPWQTVGLSHGNRVRKLQTGEVHVKIACGPVPIADIYGNANGLMGKEDQLLRVITIEVHDKFKPELYEGGEAVERSDKCR